MGVSRDRRLSIRLTSLACDPLYRADGGDIELLGECLAVDLAGGIESGLAAEVDRAPARRANDGVRVADRRRELGRPPMTLGGPFGICRSGSSTGCLPR